MYFSRNIFAVVIISGALSSIYSEARSQNLIQNGGFESPTVTGPLGYNYRTTNQIDNWEVISPPGNPGIPQFNVSYSAVGEGLQAIQLDSPGEGISQNIPTIPGFAYRLDFLLSAYSGPAATLEVQIDGGGNLLSATSSSYVAQSLSFLAVAYSTKIDFLNSGQLFSYPHLDSVSVVAVPESGTLPMLTAGLFAIACFAKRRAGSGSGEA